MRWAAAGLWVWAVTAGVAWAGGGPATRAATGPAAVVDRPWVAPMNADAARGSLIFVMVRVGNDPREVPFIVDTGTTGTALDRSLEASLGKRLATGAANHWGSKLEMGVYESPVLYLAGRPLKMTGNRTNTLDLQAILRGLGRPAMGILGMDVLENHCVQFDFEKREMRVLDGERADRSGWGKAFAIVAMSETDPRPAVAENLMGQQGPHSLIDSGFYTEGWLMKEHYRAWANPAEPPGKGQVHWPNGTFGGDAYPMLRLQDLDVEADGIGLRFLARHLVTLDFPRKTMYLKRVSVGPLPDERAAKALGGLLRGIGERVKGAD